MFNGFIKNRNVEIERLRAVAILLVVFLLAAVPEIFKNTPTGLRVLIFSALGGMLPLLASFNNNLVLNVYGIRSILLWIGQHYYGIYLIHIPAFCITKEIVFVCLPELGNPGLTYFSIAIALIVVFSELSYRFIEASTTKYGRMLAH